MEAGKRRGGKGKKKGRDEGTSFPRYAPDYSLKAAGFRASVVKTQVPSTADLDLTLTRSRDVCSTHLATD